MRARSAFIALGTLLASVVGPAHPALAAVPYNLVFASTGTEQQWLVPAGLTSVHIVVIGGHGGAAESTARAGGQARRLEGDLPVTPGTTLYIEVGGNGGNGAGGTGGAGGFNGGGAGGSGGLGAGGGGGASDIRTIARSQAGTLDSRGVVAAGAGGGGTGADGGDGAVAGGSVSGRASGGGSCTASSDGTGGISYPPDGTGGADGAAGAGGAGASKVGPGGGGGGGWYAGGGGGGDGDLAVDGAAGGGGCDHGGPIVNGAGSWDATGVPSITLTFIDTTTPTVTAPVASLTVGSAIGSSVPVRLTWKGSDTGSGIGHYEVWLSTNGGSYVLVSSPTGAGYTRSLTMSSTTTYRFRVRAFDRAGNVSAFAYGPTFHARLTQQSSTSVHYGGTWSTGLSSSASGGSYRYTSTAGRYATYTFAGRTIAIVAYKGTTLGSLKVYVDGAYRATASDYATSTQWRRIVYSLNLASGTHTIKLVCVGTSGHPRIDLDAFVVLG